jgi:hypothetical protein
MWFACPSKFLFGVATRLSIHIDDGPTTNCDVDLDQSLSRAEWTMASVVA